MLTAVVIGITQVFISVFFLPFLGILITIIVLTVLGKSLGFRKRYIRCLLRLFEFGRKRIEVADRKRESVANYRPRKSFIGSFTWTAGHSRSNSLNGMSRFPNLISRDVALSPEPDNSIKKVKAASTNNLKDLTKSDSVADVCCSDNDEVDEYDKKEFHWSDIVAHMKFGFEAIIEDEVTQCFEAEDLKSWNLLTRTTRHYEFISWRLTFLWVIGFLVRYCFLLPCRILICCFGIFWMAYCMPIIGCIPEGRIKRHLSYWIQITCFRVLSSSLSAVITYHNLENKPKGGICVANHTSPIDVLMLACDNNYALVGQIHGGLLGILERALARASYHIWFERSEVKDRELVARRLKEHVEHPDRPPVLIFPEGTCINNTSVMQFKKGSFEVGTVIYPVAIKYDPRFGDAFWNSAKYSMIPYLYMMMSSWAIVCDVWYLPPMMRMEGESAIDFANRVKAEIAKKGGLVDLVWDGQLKRSKPKKEWMEQQQTEFSKRLKLE